MKKKKQLVHEEYFVHGNYIKKLYNFYIHQSIFDKILDVLVLFAIIFTIMGVVLEFLIGVDEYILHYIHLFSSVILLIFTLELIRDYAKSKTYRAFFRKHWVDVILVTLLSLYFIFSYFGLSKLRGLNSIKTYLQEAKHFRVIFNLFNK